MVTTTSSFISTLNPYYQLYGDPSSPVWLMGYEPAGDCKDFEAALSDKANWPMTWDFKRDNERKLSRYEKSCLEIAELCFNQFKMPSKPDQLVFRGNMFPLPMPGHRQDNFDKCYRHRLGLSFKEYKRQCFYQRRPVLRNLMASHPITETAPCGFRLLFFTGKAINWMGRDFVPPDCSWSTSNQTKAFRYAWDPEIRTIVIRCHHLSYPGAQSLVMSCIAAHWDEFCRLACEQSPV